MASLRKFSNPTVIINNSVLPIIPNSVTYTEGFGEQEIKVQSAGGGSIQTVLSTNVETNCSMFKCSIHNTADNIELARTYKTNENNNAITITGDTGFSRAFNNAALISDYEVGLGSDSNIELEFKSDPAV